MGIVAKHSIRFTIIYYVGVILGYINTVILFPNILEPDEFGLTRMLLTVSIVIAQFAQLGSTGMVIRYYPMLKKKIFSLGMMVCTAGIITVLSLLILFKQPFTSFYIENSELFTDHFYLLFPFGAAMVYYNLFDAYLRALYKNAFSAFLANILLRLIWTGLIVAFSLGIVGFEQFIILYCWSYALMSVISYLYIHWHNKPAILTRFNPEEKQFLKQIRSFNFFTLLAGISSFLINKVDIMMLGSMANLKITGVYAIAAYMGVVIRVPASSIARTAQVLVADAFKKDDLKAIDNLYVKSSITQFILSSGVFILILINYENITHVLPETYRNSYYIFLFLGLTQVIDSSMGINGFIMLNSKYYRTETLFSVILLALTISTNLILIPIKGGDGAALATLLSITVYNLLRFSFIWNKFSIQPFTSKTVVGLVICTLTFLIGHFVPVMGHFILDAIVRSAITVTVMVPLVYIARLSPEINEMIDSAIAKVRGYLK